LRIARVFPTKTSMTPIDQDAYFGGPVMFPKYDEVHISAVFSWDIHRASELKRQWEMVCPVVRLGGPAFGDPGGEFIPGMYLKSGITITTRGCIRHCPYCFVPKREGGGTRAKDKTWEYHSR